jgi:hypothetical protein
MPGMVVIAAAGIFAMGIAVGIVAVVSHGIRREQKHFRQGRLGQRRYGRGEHDIPAEPEYFLAMEAPDVVSRAARRLNGLYIRHLPAATRDDANTDLGVPV